MCPMKRHSTSLMVSGLMTVATVLVIAGPATAQIVRIVAADGVLDADVRIGEIPVRPGQVVSLTADEVWRDADGEPEFAFRPVEDFIWSVAEMGGDRCDPEEGCADSLYFEVTDYGINFYVPRDAPAGMRVTARLRWGTGFDSVTLVNTYVRDRSERPYWDTYLNGLGHWVMVGGTLVFVPLHHGDDWAPYRHGHWYWSVHGWTWNSYDPWGYVTDHCGHWRHSVLYGWVWIPESACHWRPAVVSFFHGPTWIGWYPFDPGWYNGYRHGYADGYNDGFWTGLWVGQRLGRKGRLAFHPGLTMVAYENFYKPGKRHKAHAGSSGGNLHSPGNHKADMSRVMVTDPVASNKAFNDAVKKGHVGPVPGGGKVPAAGRRFIADRIGSRPDEVKMLPAWDDSKGRRGMKSWMEPEGAGREMPDRYRDVTQRTPDRTVGAKADRDRGRLIRDGGGTARRGPAARPRTSRKSRDRSVAWEPRDHGLNVDPALSRKGSRAESRKVRDEGARGGKSLYDFQGRPSRMDTKKPSPSTRLRPHEDRSSGRPPATTRHEAPARKADRSPGAVKKVRRSAPAPAPKARGRAIKGRSTPPPKRSVSKPAPAYKAPKKARRPKKPERSRRVQSPPRSRPTMDRPDRGSSNHQGRPGRRR